MIKFIGKTRIDFLAGRQIALAISGLAILIGIISLITHGGPNLSIDFRGGLSLLLRVSEPEGSPRIDEEMVRASLTKTGLDNAEVKTSRSPEGEDLLIRTKEEGRYNPPEASIRGSLDAIIPNQWRYVPDSELAPKGLPDLQGFSYVSIVSDASRQTLKAVLDSSDVIGPVVHKHRTIGGRDVWVLAGRGRDTASRIRTVLAEDYPNYKIDIRSIDRVGPRIGSELQVQALLSIFAALGLIIVYLWWRFELLFGVAAVIALFHDVMITLGVFSILNLEISITIIGAFLTLVGYSLNDTIVMFDRIRENLRRFRDAEYGPIINRSINDNLSRTIITSMTTLLVVLVLYFKGGEVLHDFALALVVGIIVGTYSSVFIASPILVEWATRTGKMAGQKLRNR